MFYYSNLHFYSTPTESLNTLVTHTTNTVSDDRTSFNTAIYTGSIYHSLAPDAYKKSTTTLPVSTTVYST